MSINQPDARKSPHNFRCPSYQMYRYPHATSLTPPNGLVENYNLLGARCKFPKKILEGKDDQAKSFSRDAHARFFISY